MKRPRRNPGATFKAQVAFAAIKGDKPVAELAEQFSVHPTRITDWKQQLLAWAADITYLPMQRGFVYRCVILDRASRLVVAWRFFIAKPIIIDRS